MKLGKGQGAQCGHTMCWEAARDAGDGRQVECIKTIKPSTWRKYSEDCDRCWENRSGQDGPSHYGSPLCLQKSSLSSGGNYSHCSCDTCNEDEICVIKES